MTCPNFFLIGAAKCGTTSLYHYLRQHKEIFLSPVKEPGYYLSEAEKDSIRELGFAGDPVRTKDHYQFLFASRATEKAVGEASVLYLWSEYAPPAIFADAPQARILAILRNPIERADSHFRFLRKQGIEWLESFEEALDLEEERLTLGMAPFYFYTRRGLYAQQINRYRELFPPRQIKLCLYEDLAQHPLETMQSIYEFLEVDASFTPDVSFRHNVTGNAPGGSSRQTSEQGKCNRVVPEAQPEAGLTPATRQRLLDFFRPDILQLQEIMSRELSSWLGANQAESTLQKNILQEHRKPTDVLTDRALSGPYVGNV